MDKKVNMVDKKMRTRQWVVNSPCAGQFPDFTKINMIANCKIVNHQWPYLLNANCQ